MFLLEHTAQFVPAAADVDEKGDIEKLAGRLTSSLTAKGIKGFDPYPFYDYFAECEIGV